MHNRTPVKSKCIRGPNAVEIKHTNRTSAVKGHRTAVLTLLELKVVVMVQFQNNLLLVKDQIKVLD